MVDDPFITWFRENLAAPGKTQAGLGDALGIDQSAVSRIKAGRRKVSTSELAAAAAYFGVPLPTSEIRTAAPEVNHPVVVAGRVAAGSFLEVDDMDQSEPERISEPADPQFPHARRMAFDVDGDSVNALKPRPIMPGDRIICVSWEDVADRVKVRDGLVVVVERTRDGGHTREWSVKQIELYEDRIEFHPRSTNPKHKPIVVLRDAAADDGVVVEIIGLVRSIRNDIPL